MRTQANDHPLFYGKLFVERKEKAKDLIRDLMRSDSYVHYLDLVQVVLKTVVSEEAGDESYNAPDIENIVAVDHGDYQGFTLYIIPTKDYQPSTYYSTHNFYGSCSGCDSLEAAYCRFDEDDWKSEDEATKARIETAIEDLYALSLGLAQRLRKFISSGSYVWDDEDLS